MNDLISCQFSALGSPRVTLFDESANIIIFAAGHAKRDKNYYNKD